MAMVSKGAAILVKDADAAVELVPKAMEIIQNKQTLAELGGNMLRLSVTDAADRIARKVHELALQNVKASNRN
jgi:UDP-N-acetylglucosamine--N-acetylmuramyl-(pentapeptide) pyrophosphoryl-undecaprenol N-acetylglucosamine transferase